MYFILLFIILYILMMINNNMNNILLLINMKLILLYWVMMINFIISFMFVLLWNCLNLYNTMVFNNKLFSLSWFMLMIVMLISSSVIINSIDYPSIIDSYPSIFYIILPVLSMINFIPSHNIIQTYLYWDLLGLFPYLLINFRSSKVNCGIKAVLYNKMGDNFFLFIMVFFYFNLSFINYYPSLLLSILLSFSLYFFVNSLSISIMIFNYIIMFIIPFSLLFILFSKSAQLPFSSWLLNAMSAPTPISAPLHSSTMVMAGVFIGIIINDLIITIMNYLSMYFILFILLPFNTLLRSLSSAMSLNDMKSIIALSTISQMSYMFISMLINPLLCLYHMIMHALFKSLLPLLSGSLMHIQYNYQNMYKIKINYNLYSIMYLLLSFMSILSLSKEIIIFNILFINSLFILFFFIITIIITIIYILLLYYYMFYY